MNQALKLKVNEKALVNNLRFAFTNKHTVIAELMQNSRRSGATSIEINFEEKGKAGSFGTLTVKDNGCGITDFSVLVNVAETGWNEDIIAEEKPFGMGWLSALFGAKQVTVISGDKQICVKTEDVLNFQEFHVEPASIPTKKGTIVIMEGFDMNLYSVDQEVKKYATGFPVEIIYNGTTLPRKHAINETSLLWVDTQIGKISISSNDENIFLNDLNIYLQGICVNHVQNPFGYWDRNSTVVHLDPKKFTARMPDRDTLINYNDVRLQIQKTIKQEWRKILEAKKQSIDPKEFVDKYWNVASQSGNLDVMNDVPYLPGSVVNDIEMAPYNVENDRGLEYISPGSIISKEEVISGEVILCENIEEMLDGQNYVANLFAFHKEWKYVMGDLPAKHWAKEYIVDLTDNDDFGFEIIGSGKEQMFSGAWAYCNIVLCDSIILKYKDDNITLSNQSLPVQEVNDAYKQCSFYVPSDDVIANVDMLMMNDYMNDYDYMENELREDVNAINDMINVMRGENPEVTLLKILNATEIKSYENLQNKSFVVSVIKYGPNDAKRLVKITVQEVLKEDE